MTIIELNIAGLHVTRSRPDFTREAFKRSWQRNCREFRRKSAQWRPAPLRTRPASERPAA
jgi:hypothetical protein